MAAAWMGVGSVIPSPASCSASEGETPSAVKGREGWEMGIRLGFGEGAGTPNDGPGAGPRPDREVGASPPVSQTVILALADRPVTRIPHRWPR